VTDVSAESLSLPAWLLEAMQCPLSSQPLSVAPGALVEQLRQKRKAGELTTLNGAAVEEDFQSGLINASSQYFYPIREGIPSLLPDEALPLNPAHGDATTDG
jgi:uncharacterized protein YbaR (Trm112 family)